MRNPEILNQAVKEKTEAEKQKTSELNILANQVRKDQLLKEITVKPAIDPAVKELVVNALRHAQEKQLSLVAWTQEIMEGAERMTKDLQEEVIELTAKVTARQGIPTFENPILKGEGQIEAA